MRRGFTLIELLVVIAIIALLMGIIVPVVGLVREHGAETVCRSNLRQMTMTLKTYQVDNDGFFPPAGALFHSDRSFDPPYDDRGTFKACCRWHDPRMGLDSVLLREQPELQGSLNSYLGDTSIVQCRVGRRANREQGHVTSKHDPNIPVIPQYTYAMNSYLGAGFLRTARTLTGAPTGLLAIHSIRHHQVLRATQVTRSPAKVFAFGEWNSWAVNREGYQPLGPHRWEAPYNLSTTRYRRQLRDHIGSGGKSGFSALQIQPSWWFQGRIGATRRVEPNGAESVSERSTLHLKASDEKNLGDAFATCHRPPGGDLNAGHSYAVMLDGHAEKITVADQLRRSRRPPHMEESRLGPGGNLALAWPLDIPPPGGWENQ